MYLRFRKAQRGHSSPKEPRSKGHVLSRQKEIVPPCFSLFIPLQWEKHPQRKDLLFSVECRKKFQSILGTNLLQRGKISGVLQSQHGKAQSQGPVKELPCAPSGPLQQGSVGKPCKGNGFWKSSWQILASKPYFPIQKKDHRVLFLWAKVCLPCVFSRAVS